MSEMRFPRWLAAVGVLGGVAIALGLPWVTLVYGSDLGGAKVAIIILALIAGCALATISAVVGITIPTAVRGAIAMPAVIPNCCEPEREAEQDEVETETESST
jgi:hypothetical protein